MCFKLQYKMHLSRLENFLPTWDTTAATTLARRTIAMVSPELLAAAELSMGSPNSSLAPGFCSTDSTAKKTPEMGALKPAATPA